MANFSKLGYEFLQYIWIGDVSRLRQRIVTVHMECHWGRRPMGLRDTKYLRIYSQLTSGNLKHDTKRREKNNFIHTSKHTHNRQRNSVLPFQNMSTAQHVIEAVQYLAMLRFSQAFTSLAKFLWFGSRAAQTLATAE